MEQQTKRANVRRLLDLLSALIRLLSSIIRWWM